MAGRQSHLRLAICNCGLIRSFMLTNIEMGKFAKLFIDGGHVLNFTTADFDAFTMASTGVPLQAL